MKKFALLYLLLSRLCVGLNLGTPALEALLVSCQGTGHALYADCVATPPKDVASCGVLLATYTTCSTKLNLPYPMKLAKDPDPYIWSPFDPCRFEVQRVILWDICPSSPIG